MAYTFLIFEFAANEEAAQLARHKIDAWKQGFRLGNKILSKFERTETAGDAAQTKAYAKPEKEKKGAKKAGEAAEDAAAPAVHIRMLVRLDFSDHEKLSFQRWIDRIPKEEPFQSAHGKIIRPGEPNYGALTDQFDSLS